jgi:dolichyl-diphosphooligosaccharide--protein glycosyltransferase
MGNYVRKKNIKPYFLPVILAVSAIFIFCVVKIFVPFLWIELIKIFNEINLGMVDNQFAREFIGEMSPLRLRGAFSSYYALFYLFLISLCILLYRFVKERRPENFFIFIWTIVILVTAGIIPAFGQNRNSYYLSVNISLLAGFLIIEGFLFGWKALKRLDEFEKNSYLRLYFRVSSIIIISAIIFLFLYPFPFNIDDGYPNSLPSLIRSSISTAQNPSVLSDDWYQTFSWLKDNTPDPGIDYYALYKEPKTWAYNYPSQAYSILAPWDVGHDITYYARRIPVANPFQQGIGYINSDGTITPGEGTFFLETDEGRAISYLDRLKTKYIIVSTLLSNPNTTFKSYVKWINGNMESYTSDEVLETQPTKFDLAMSTRLYFLDGSHVFLDKKVKEENIKLEIPQLSHFKLVYESKNDTSIFLENQYSTTKQVKVFEYVKGATIRGYTLPGTRVEISTNVKTNQNREFGYKQETVSKDGSFEFVVPYSTGNQENSDVSAGEYTIKIGNYSIKIRVLNEDIMKGRIIKI